MDLVERVRALLTQPAATWTAIEREPASFQSLYVPYLCALAVVPAFANFMAWSVPGMGSLGASFNLSIPSALALVLTQYGMTMVMVFVWGWIISVMAGAFGGQSNLLNGVKLSVYASTPALLAGVFNAMPGMSFLALAGGVYALYLLYLGLPVLMRCPPGRALPYLAVTSLVALVGSLLISMTSAWFLPGPWTTQEASTQPVVPAVPASAPASAPVPVATDSTVTIQTPDGQKRVMAESMQDMVKRLEALAAAQEKARQASDANK